MQVPSFLHRHPGASLHLEDQQVVETDRRLDFRELGQDQSLQWRRYCQILNCRGPRMTGIVFQEGGNLTGLLVHRYRSRCWFTFFRNTVITVHILESHRRFHSTHTIGSYSSISKAIFKPVMLILHVLQAGCWFLFL